MALAVSNDGSRLVCGAADGVVAVFDVGTGKFLHKLEGHNQCVRDVTFSPDGKTVFTACDDGHVHVYDAHNRSLLESLSGHEGWVLGVSASRDGNALATCGADAKVRIGAPKSKHLRLRTYGVQSAGTTHHETDPLPRPSLFRGLRTTQVPCFISQLVTVPTDYPDCCPYIVQYIAIYRDSRLTPFFALAGEIVGHSRTAVRADVVIAERSGVGGRVRGHERRAGHRERRQVRGDVSVRGVGKEVRETRVPGRLCG